jgi:toxin YhaV
MTSRSTDEIFAAMNPPPPRSNGWWLLSWREFQRQLEALVGAVEQLRDRDPDGYRSHPRARLLAAVLRLVEVDIPRDPGHADFRQSTTLGASYTGWYRAKFHQRFRLFYRYQTSVGAIVYAWMNTESGLRKSGDRNDPYNVFRKMLDRGVPPTGFDALLRESAALRLPLAGESG